MTSPTQNPPVSSLVFALSHEELVFLMGLMQLTTLPGMESDVLGSFQQSGDGPARLAVAQHTLLARQLISVDSDQHVNVDQVVATILLNCAGARATLTLTSIDNQPQTVETTVFDVGPQLIIAHSRPQPGVHHFQPIANLKTLAAAILTETHVRRPHAPTPYPSLLVPPDLIAQAQQAIRDGDSIDAVLDMLEDAGLAEQEANLLYDVLANVSTSHLVIGFDLQSESEIRGGALSILHSADDVWLVQPAGEEMVSVSCVGAAEVAGQIVELLRTVLPDLFAG